MIGPRAFAASSVLVILTLVIGTLVVVDPGRNVHENPALSSVSGAPAADRQVGPAPVSSDDQNTADPAPGDYKKIFRRDLFMGDSVTQGLVFFDFLDDSTVLAKLGLNLVTARDELGKVGLAQPDKIFILFGENDLNYYPDNHQLIDSYAGFIRAVKERSPRSDIYVQSVLPIAAKAEAGNPNLNNARIDEVDIALSGMARDEGAHYLDLTAILKNRDDLYQPDGKHFEEQFYKLWLDYLVKNVK